MFRFVSTIMVLAALVHTGLGDSSHELENDLDVLFQANGIPALN